MLTNFHSLYKQLQTLEFELRWIIDRLCLPRVKIIIDPWLSVKERNKASWRLDAEKDNQF